MHVNICQTHICKYMSKLHMKIQVKITHVNMSKSHMHMCTETCKIRISVSTSLC